MFDINLVPEVQKQKQQLAQRNTYATIAAISILGAVVLGLVVLGSLKVAANISLKNTEKDITAVKTESANYAELEASVLSLENGLAGIKKSLDGQNNWTRLLTHLEAATPSDTQYTSLALEGNTATAQLLGKNVDSVGRFIDSYKNYKVLVISGTGTPQGTVSVSVNGATEHNVTVKTDGTWVYATSINFNESNVIEATEGQNTSKVTYNASTKKITSESGSISASAENLFSNVNTKQYSKEGNTVNFDATFNFKTEALW